MEQRGTFIIKGDLGGTLSVKLKEEFSLEQYCAQHLDDFNPDRFEVVAIRLLYGKDQYVTIYAMDKSRMEGDNYNHEKIPVKKFKTDISFIKDLLPLTNEVNFTLTTGNYPMEDIEVMNK